MNEWLFLRVFSVFCLLQRARKAEMETRGKSQNRNTAKRKKFASWTSGKKERVRENEQIGKFIIHFRRVCLEVKEKLSTKNELIWRGMPKVSRSVALGVSQRNFHFTEQLHKINDCSKIYTK